MNDPQSLRSPTNPLMVSIKEFFFILLDRLEERPATCCRWAIEKDSAQDMKDKRSNEFEEEMEPAKVVTKV